MTQFFKTFPSYVIIINDRFSQQRKLQRCEKHIGKLQKTKKKSIWLVRKADILSPMKHGAATPATMPLDELAGRKWV